MEPITVQEALVRYWGSRTKVCRKGELVALRYALLAVTRPFGALPVAEFGSRELKAVRRTMTDARPDGAGLGRRTINHRILRVKAAFRWLAEEEIIPAEIWVRLQALRGLRRNEGGREAEPVRPAEPADIEAVYPFLPPSLRDMLRLQLLTGMRSGELCAMRTCDVVEREVDEGERLLIYRPPAHKTAHHGHARQIVIGPEAERIIRPRLDPGRPERHLFSAAQTFAERGLRHRLPMGREPGPRWTSDGYGKAIRKAVRRARARDAALQLWHPHQLRHTAATRIREEFGIEAAQAVLGHASLAMTQVYAQVGLQRAIDVMRQIG